MRKLKKTIFPFLAVLLILIGLTNSTSNASTTSAKLKISYIDVGQADSILIQTPTGKNMLIDAGNNEDVTTVKTYLKNHGVKRLDVVVGTHPHEDHIGALDDIIKAYPVGQIIMPKVSSNTKTYSDVLNAIKVKKLKVTTAKSGLWLNLGTGIGAVVVAPTGINYEDLNNYSVVIKLTYGKTSFLFDGDAETISENQMRAGKIGIKADVLKIGHHGSDSSTSPAFLSVVKPKYAIISVGKGNTFGHPAQTTLTKLTKAGVKTYRTDINGTVTVVSDGKVISFAMTKGTQVKTTVVYIGTKTTHKFHIPSCRYVPVVANRVNFSSRDAAIKAGYVPCKVCKP